MKCNALSKKHAKRQTNYSINDGLNQVRSMDRSQSIDKLVSTWQLNVPTSSVSWNRAGAPIPDSWNRRTARGKPSKISPGHPNRRPPPAAQIDSSLYNHPRLGLVNTGTRPSREARKPKNTMHATNSKHAQPEPIPFEACLRLAEGYDPETNYSLVLVAVLEHLLAGAADPHALS